jgi:pyruvate/2-oxoglutarate/acetoin dehydrogenase E1 component
MGEEVAQFNGAYKVTEGLLARFGPDRVVDTPISEAGFIGMGIGASMLGVRPVMELMFWSFYSVAFDQILNNAANVRYMSGGQRRRDPLAHAGKRARQSSRRESGRTRHGLRRQGAAQVRHSRQRPGLLP